MRESRYFLKAHRWNYHSKCKSIIQTGHLFLWQSQCLLVLWKPAFDLHGINLNRVNLSSIMRRLSSFYFLVTFQHYPWSHLDCISYFVKSLSFYTGSCENKYVGINLTHTHKKTASIKKIFSSSHKELKESRKELYTFMSLYAVSTLSTPKKREMWKTIMQFLKVPQFPHHDLITIITRWY